MKYDLNKLIMYNKPSLFGVRNAKHGRDARAVLETAYKENMSKDETLRCLRTVFCKERNRERIEFCRKYELGCLSKPGSKKYLACSYIVGKGVPRDFNKAFEVYPVRENPICEFQVYINGELKSVGDLLFGE